MVFVLIGKLKVTFRYMLVCYFIFLYAFEITSQKYLLSLFGRTNPSGI